MSTPIPTPADLLASNFARTADLTPAERAELATAAEAALARIAAILGEG